MTKKTSNGAESERPCSSTDRSEDEVVIVSWEEFQAPQTPPCCQEKRLASRMGQCLWVAVALDFGRHQMRPPHKPDPETRFPEVLWLPGR